MNQGLSPNFASNIKLINFYSDGAFFRKKISTADVRLGSKNALVLPIISDVVIM